MSDYTHKTKNYQLIRCFKQAIINDYSFELKFRLSVIKFYLN